MSVRVRATHRHGFPVELLKAAVSPDLDAVRLVTEFSAEHIGVLLIGGYDIYGSALLREFAGMV
jgi:hypothetical protein